MTRGLGGGIRCQAWTRLGLMWGLWGEERQKKKTVDTRSNARQHSFEA